MSFLPFGRNNLRQRHLSKNKATPHLLRQQHSTQSRSVQDRAHSSLTFSQALTITAGMAGLVGLLSGVLVRFSLANSSNARFLSPLQTFPELSDWSSVSTPEVANASEEISEESSSGLWRSPAELDWDTDTQNFDTFSSESFTDSQSTTEITLEDPEIEASPFIESEGTASRSPAEKNAQNFDAFADRVEGQRRVDAIDPFKALSRGPLLGKPTSESSGASVDDNNWENGWEEIESEETESVDSLYESTSQDRVLGDEEYETIEGASLYDTQRQNSASYEDDRYEDDLYEDDSYSENESW